MPPKPPSKPKTDLTITLLGSPHTGKSALLSSYLFNIHPTFYHPTLDQIFISPAPPSHPHLWQITYYDQGTGPNSSTQLLPVRIAASDVIIITFSLIHRSTLTAALEHWYSESQNQGPKPIILVGTMKDLRPPVLVMGEGRQEVIEWEGSNAADDMGAKAYLECSALTEEGLADVFDAAVRVGLGEEVLERKKTVEGGSESWGALIPRVG